MSVETREAQSSSVAYEPNLYGYGLRLLIVLAKYKAIVLSLPAVSALITAAVVLLIPNTYTAVTRILPPQQNQSAAAAAFTQLGALTGLGGQALGIKNPNDLYVGMLTSRTVADGLIDRFGLKALYERKTLDETRSVLEAHSRIFSSKDGLINIEFDDQDPKRAAAVANGYVEELYRLTQTLAVTEASQRRLFFERQLALAKTQLADAEAELKKTQEATGLFVLDEQGRAIISAVANLHAQIAAKEVELSAMRSFATDKNPAYVVAQQEITSLKAQLQRLEKAGTLQKGGMFVPTEKVPEAGLEYVRRLRDVKYHEAIFELLAKQYEIAKADEAREASIVQVLDRAVEPERKSKPKRGLIVILVTLLAGFAAVVAALAREAIEVCQRDPVLLSQLRTLIQYLRLRRD